MQLKLGHCLAFSSFLHNINIPPIAVFPLSENLSVNTASQHFCREIIIPVAQNREKNLLHCTKQSCVKLCKAALPKDQTSIFCCHCPMPGKYTTSTAFLSGFLYYNPLSYEMHIPWLRQSTSGASPAEPDWEPRSPPSVTCVPSFQLGHLPAFGQQGLFLTWPSAFACAQGEEVSSAGLLP